MGLGITALGSGSGGNAFVVHSGGGNILIDAGFSRRELLRRMEEAHVDPTSIRAVLLSHEHDDHVKGCRVFCDQFHIPLCASFETLRYLRHRKTDRLPANIHQFVPGSKFEICGMTILPFTVQHDAVDPVGFVINGKESKIGFASDLGAVNSLAKMRLSDCDILILESNHDLDMLRNSDRQMHLKKRIAGPHGHLNNLAAMLALEELLSVRTRVLMLVHASSECNDYALVRTLAEGQLEKLQRNDIMLRIVEQNNIVETIFLDELN